MTLEPCNKCRRFPRVSTHTTWCKECHKLWQKRRLQDHREKISRYKLTLGCAECGFGRCARALHLHHLGGKEFGVSQMAGRVKWEKIAAEIEKCEVLCGNCHMMRHCENESCCG